MHCLLTLLNCFNLFIVCVPSDILWPVAFNPGEEGSKSCKGVEGKPDHEGAKADQSGKTRVRKRKKTSRRLED